MNTVSIAGYHLREQLYSSARTLVYRGIREADSRDVVIKVLKNPYPSFRELLSFRNQYTIAKNLRSPNIIQTYSLEPCQNGYGLVMEDFGGISLKDFAATEAVPAMSVEEFLQIAIELCNALDTLYRHHIIHKDIKPSNILINPETNQIKLIDFSIASLLPRETQTIISPNVLEGTLAYISPEQTGRMNRLIDYRTDFYSLGVTFYELLTGELPFHSEDAMELVYYHIAKTPMALENRQEIPHVLSDIVMKLMAKNASDRYQSALGLKYDLEKCLLQLEETGKIEDFPIAQRDVCDRFLIPDKLYGRESEVETLLQGFERISKGTTEMMLVAGFSGIGKTAVVNEVHKPIVRQRGYFIKGKFDQFQRNIPFSAFVQAFRDLMGQLLTESDFHIQQWKNQILDAVGQNGQVIIEVIPELERIIGQQPPTPQLSGTGAQNRFNLLFQKFVQIFTTAEHPLVIFLDDLQWADSASLKLIKMLMTESAKGYLLLIGAYRDNEVSAAHPLILSLAKIIKSQATVNTITLDPLSNDSLNQLIADTLNCATEIAQPLSKLVYQKTSGNPFFSTQFLKALYEDGLIKFDYEQGNWQCNTSEVKALALTDNVVEFMALQLQKLPEATQSVLKLAACIGNQFDLANLAIISQQSEIETSAGLWQALQSGLILPTSEIYKFYIEQSTQNLQQNSQIVNYKFLHDRIQQAAYSLIPPDETAAVHLSIGRLLQRHTKRDEPDLQLFEIVNQLNRGISLIDDAREREELAHLNKQAGAKARVSAAYDVAMTYLDTGLQLLPPQCWQNQYELSLELHQLAAEVTYLSGNHDQLKKLLAIGLQQTHHLLDRAKFYEIQILALAAQNQARAAVEYACNVLPNFGVRLPQKPSKLQTMLGFFATVYRMLGKNPRDLLKLPAMSDPYKLAACNLISAMGAAASTGMPEILPFMTFQGISLYLRYGNIPKSSMAYMIYAFLLCEKLGRIDAGYALGKAAIELCHQTASSRAALASTLFLWHRFIGYRKESLHRLLPLLLEAYQVSLEVGDLEYAAYNLTVYFGQCYFIGRNLVDLKQEAIASRPTIEKLQQRVMTNLQDLFCQILENLTTQTDDVCQLVGRFFDETLVWEPEVQVYISLQKIMLAFWFDRYELATKQIAIAEKLLSKIDGTFLKTLFYFYDGLVRLALYPNLTKAQQKAYLAQVNTHRHRLAVLAVRAPTNYLHKRFLLEAEYLRVLGKPSEAIDFYDRAISGAKANEYIQEEALANKLAAKFYLNWEKEKVAQGYMQEAYYCYAKWGAYAKTEDLEKRYPQLLQPILQQQQINLTQDESIPTIAQSNLSSTALDLTSILKAAQTISSSIELHELVANLTKIILENSGAKKSVFILPEEDTWQVRAITLINHQDNSEGQIQTTLTTQIVDDCQDIPIKLINYVKNIQQTVIIDNCQTDIPGVIGEYMLQHQPQSVLCTPIINQGHLVGILYLENRLTCGVFTTERLQVINLLSSQAAISLENARLYQQARLALQDLQQAQLQIIQSEKMSALGNLVAGVAHEMNNPLGFISASLEQAKPMIADIFEHLNLYQQTLGNPSDEIIKHAKKIDLKYSLADLPNMIDSMTMACERLENISTSLRTFSRDDKDYKVPFNIHSGIDSTILILKHRLKANNQRPVIEVTTNYGNLPEIECFPGQLNQVFMNILANAIDALEESNIERSFEEIKANPNRITITTSVRDNLFQVTISDNGVGMDEQVKQKIFDHLFTTKAVKKGTGLGLAIAQQIIVEKHNGTLAVNSIPSQGTEFIISLPIL